MSITGNLNRKENGSTIAGHIASLTSFDVDVILTEPPIKAAKSSPIT